MFQYMRNYKKAPDYFSEWDGKLLIRIILRLNHPISPLQKKTEKYALKVRKVLHGLVAFPQRPLSCFNRFCIFISSRSKQLILVYRKLSRNTVFTFFIQKKPISLLYHLLVLE